jgi:tRNA (mo5U34)-methyltransferase
VQRRELSVHELAPDDVGTFDLVFVGDLLLHLRDPIGALERVRSVCSGELVVADVVELLPTLLHPRLPVARLEARGRPWWWLPNRAGLERLVESAGFEIVARSGLYYVALGVAHPRSNWRAVLGDLGSPGGPEKLVARVRGIPHAALRARPLP